MLKNNNLEFTLYNKDPDYTLLLLDENSGGFVFVHNKADNIDLDLNIKISSILATNGYKVVIREHKKKGKNPELLLNGELCDIKTPIKTRSIGNGFAHAQNQGINCFVSNLELEFSLKDFEFGISNGFSKNNYINYVIFVKKETVIKITREMFEKNVYLKEIIPFINEKG